MDRRDDDRPVSNDDLSPQRPEAREEAELQRRGFLFVLGASAVAIGSGPAWGRSLLLLQKHQGGGDPPPTSTTKSASMTEQWSLSTPWHPTTQSWTHTTTTSPPYTGPGTTTNTSPPPTGITLCLGWITYTLGQSISINATESYTFAFAPSDVVFSDTYSWDGGFYTVTRAAPPHTQSTSGSISKSCTYTAPVPGCGNCPPFAFGLESDASPLNLETIDGQRDVRNLRSRSGEPFRFKLGI
jgi:hypothetical protein